MANQTDQYTIAINAKSTASKALAKLRAELARLGGPEAVKLRKELNKVQREIGLLNKEAGSSPKIFTRFTSGIAIGNIAAVAFGKAMSAVSNILKEFLVESTKVAARIEVMGAVYNFTGQRVGYSITQLNKYRQEIIANGIAEKEGLGILQRAIQSRFDLTKAITLSRIAQNAATITGENSSEAATNLMDAILKQRPILLKQYGILVNLTTLYPQYAKAIGKTTDALTAADKRTALYNAVLEQSQTIAGAYSTAMNLVGKRITSLPRHFQAAQKAIGEYFLPAMEAAVNVTEDFLKGIKRAFGDDLSRYTANIAKFESKILDNTDAIIDYSNSLAQLENVQNRTTEQNKEYYNAMAQIGKLLPETIAGYDDQNRVITYNADAVRKAYFSAYEYYEYMKGLKREDLTVMIREQNLELRKQAESYAEIVAQRRNIITMQEGGAAPTLIKSAQLVLETMVEDAEKAAKNAEFLTQQIVAMQEELSGGAPDIVQDPDEIEAAANALQEYTAVASDQFGQLLAWQKMSEAQRLESHARLMLGFGLLDEQQALAWYNREVKKLEDAQAFIELQKELQAQYAEDVKRLAQELMSANAAAIEQQKEKLWMLENVLSSVGSEMTRLIQVSSVWGNVLRSIASAAISKVVKSIISMLAKSTATITAITAEVVAVNSLTASYIALAAAKAAAGAMSGPLGFVGGILNALKLFDDPENDRMAMRMGSDYAKYFSQGAVDYLDNTANLGQSFAKQTAVPMASSSTTNSNSMSLTVHLHGNATPAESHGLITKIEELIQDKFMPYLNTNGLQITR